MSSLVYLASVDPIPSDGQRFIAALGHLFQMPVDVHHNRVPDPTDLPADVYGVILDSSLANEAGYLFIKELVLHSDVKKIPTAMINTTGILSEQVEGIWVDPDCYIKESTDSNTAASDVYQVFAKKHTLITEEGLQNKVRFLVQSKLKYLFEVNNIISQLFSKTALEESDIINLRLTLDELGTNAIRHGNLNDPAKIVIIFCHLFDNFLSISIEDQGDGFDVKDIPDPTTTERILLPSGRGIFIARQLMDSVEYQGSGNKVVFKKKLPAVKTPS